MTVRSAAKIKTMRVHASASLVLALSCPFGGCTSARNDLAYVGEVHVRDVPPVPFHVAIRPLRVENRAASPALEDADTLAGPSPSQIDTWTLDLSTRLKDLNLSDVAVEVSTQPLQSSPFDLAVEVQLDWPTTLQVGRHNIVGSGLAWGFLWPLSVTSIAAVEDRNYATAVRATVKLVWTGAQEQVAPASLGDLQLTLPQRQDSIWWKVAAFSPIYFWVPDDPTCRTQHLQRLLLDRLALVVAQSVKANPQRRFDGYTWQGDRLEIDAPAGLEVSVVGGTRTPDQSRQRYLIPREADHVRLSLKRTARGVEESWTQTIRRPRP